MPTDRNPLFSRSAEPHTELKPSNLNVEIILAEAHVSDSVRQSLAEADVILVPTREIRGEPEVAFPQGTVQVLKFLKSHAPPHIKFEVPVEDNDYKELELHFDLTILPTLFMTIIVAPTIVGLMVAYLQEKFVGHSEKVTVKSTIHVSEKDRVIEIEYEGPVDKYEQVMSQQLATHKEDPIDTNEQISGTDHPTGPQT